MLHSVTISNQCVIDVGVVINSYPNLREEGLGHSPFVRELDGSHVGHVLAMAPCSAYSTCDLLSKKLAASHIWKKSRNYNSYF